jgi:Na+-transporting methylmalonyl-CoA/oxaloacetate decarboxylase gamma subunit
MRIVFGVLSLLVVLATVSWQARTQVKAVSTPVTVPAPDGSTQRINPKQIEQQYKKALEEAVNTARPRSADE